MQDVCHKVKHSIIPHFISLFLKYLNKTGFFLLIIYNPKILVRPESFQMLQQDVIKWNKVSNPLQ